MNPRNGCYCVATESHHYACFFALGVLVSKTTGWQPMIRDVAPAASRKSRAGMPGLRTFRPDRYGIILRSKTHPLRISCEKVEILFQISPSFVHCCGRFIIFYSSLLHILIQILYITLILGLLQARSMAEFTWDTTTIDGEEYVSVENIRDYYRFTEYSTSSKSIVMKSKRPDMTIDMQIMKGQPDLYIKGVRFVMSFPCVYAKGKHRISRIDQSRLIDPVIQPKRIGRSEPFHTVIIDPGHGSHDTGSRSSYGHEKAFNLSLGLKLKAELERKGVRVRMTRSDDSFPTLHERVEYANRLEGSIFISLHFNWSPTRSVHGVETYSLAPAGTESTNGGSAPGDQREYQGNMRDQENIALSTAIHAHVVKRCAASDRGIKRARFAVLTGINCPSVLLEGGFLSNPDESRKVASTDYQLKMAAAIAEGILSYRNALRSR